MNISLSDKEYISINLKNKLQLLKDSNILITGATGFFGKWLLDSFLYFNKEFDLNASLYALSRNPEAFLEQYKNYLNEKNIVWIKGDIRSFKYPAEEFNYIIHTATDADAKLNAENPLLMLDTITEGTRNILELARKQPKLRGFLFTSSGAVYGNQPGIVTHIGEKDSFYIDINNTKSAYAEGKRLSELYCSIYADKYNIPVKIARCFAFVGPYLPLDKHFAIGNFISNGLKKQNIIITGDGSPLRSYMYAADLIIWLLTLLIEGDIGEAYNVGSDKPISIKDLAFKIAGFFPDTSVIILNQVRKTDSNQNYVPDVSKFIRRFKLKNITDLDTAIQSTISYYKQEDKYD